MTSAQVELHLDRCPNIHRLSVLGTGTKPPVRRDLFDGLLFETVPQSPDYLEIGHPSVFSNGRHQQYDALSLGFDRLIGVGRHGLLDDDRWCNPTSQLIYTIACARCRALTGGAARAGSFGALAASEGADMSPRLRSAEISSTTSGDFRTTSRSIGSGSNGVGSGIGTRIGFGLGTTPFGFGFSTSGCGGAPPLGGKVGPVEPAK